jgi:predicted DNA-binding ribbon-helix-helix protein
VGFDSLKSKFSLSASIIATRSNQYRKVGLVKSTISKRSIVVTGHKTSVSLEDPFWNELKQIASLRKETLSHLIHQIDTQRDQGNLSSAIRLFVLNFYLAQIAEAGGLKHSSEVPIAPK